MKRSEEVSEQGGFRLLLVTVLASCLVGLLIRVSFSPAKVERLIRSQIELSPIRDSLIFGSAEISLADGWWPDIAVVLHRVEWRVETGCTPETSPVRALRMRVPLRLASVLAGRPSAGSAKIDDLSVDLDDLKRNCKSVSKNGGPPVATIGKSAPGPTAQGESGLAAEPKTVAEVWSESDRQKINAMITGLRVSRGEVYFEDRMKSVVLEDFSAAWRGDSLDVSTSIKFPPSTVFGENLPSFSVSGIVRREDIQAEIRAELSEGTFEATAQMKPVVTSAGIKELQADLRLAVSDLPLSVVTPLLTKSRIVTGAFHPKFVWLDCNAEVHGIFSKLFVENPVSLSDCSLSGQAGRVSLKAATRRPDGAWQPFQVIAEKVEIARVLDTFQLQGPTGVLTNFGFVSGTMNVESPEAVTAKGAITGSVVRFAGGEGVALQAVAIEKLEASLKDARWKVSLSDFRPAGGAADLNVEADVDQSGRDAKVEVRMGELKLNPRVEKVIFTGPVENISGAISFAIGPVSESGAATLSKLKSSIVIKSLQGTELTADEVKFDSQLAKGDGVSSEIEVLAKTARIEVLKTGRLFKLLEPALLGWSGETVASGDRLVLGKVAVKGRFRDHGFQWSTASASVGPVVTLVSHGRVFRDHAIDSDLEAHYPLAPKLKWNVSGTWLKPKFSSSSPELASLFAKAGLPKETIEGTVPPRLLGLPKDPTETTKP